MEEEPTVADTVDWVLRRLVIEVHERVAYSKLPNFTFRFRWENGRLRFYDLGVWPFDLADMRHGSMSQLSFDIGYWRETTDGGKLTVTERRSSRRRSSEHPAGRAFHSSLGSVLRDHLFL